MQFHLRRALEALPCHGIPERSLKFRGKPMPICARCFGVFVGNAGAATLFAFGASADPALCLATLLPLGIDWSLQTYCGVPSSNTRRVATGMVAGLGVGMIYWLGITYVLKFVLSVLPL